MLIGADAADAAAGLGAHGVTAAHVADHDGFAALRARTPGGGRWPDWCRRARRRRVIAAGSERGNEVMAHAAAICDLPLAANCIEAAPGEPATVTRLRWGGSLLEEARLHGATEAAHGRAARRRGATAAAAPVQTAVVEFTPALADADLVVRVVERTRPTPAAASRSPTPRSS